MAISRSLCDQAFLCSAPSTLASGMPEIAWNCASMWLYWNSHHRAMLPPNLCPDHYIFLLTVSIQLCKEGIGSGDLPVVIKECIAMAFRRLNQDLSPEGRTTAAGIDHRRTPWRSRSDVSLSLGGSNRLGTRRGEP